MEAKPRVRLKADDRREQILKAALPLLAQHGFNALLIKDVAKASGLTTAGLLHYFPSKDAILTAVLEERDLQYRRLVQSRPAFSAEGGDERPTPGELQAVIRDIMEFGAQRPDLVRVYVVLQVEAMNPEHPAHRYFRDGEARVASEIAELLTGWLPDPISSAREVLALKDGLELLWLRRGGSFDLAAAWNYAATKVLGGAHG